MGRDRELDELHQLLGRGDRVAIAAVGMGGIGKTRLARQYVAQHRDEYPGGIWWVAAAQVATEIVTYAQRSLGLDELDPQLSEVQIGQHYLAKWQRLFPERKLLVLDDVGEYGDVKQFLPQSGTFQVLMTTRVRMQTPVQRLDLDVLQPAAALQLLQELMQDDDRLKAEITAAQQLCQWLGYLPLGIELVGRYLAETGTIAGVLAQLRAKSLAAEPIASVPDEADYGRNVRAAIALSWEKLDAAGQRALSLSFLAEFALAPIQLAWVEAGLESAETEAEAAGAAGSVQAVLDRQLVKRSLLNKTGTDYLLHSLVREFVRGQGRDASLGQRFAEVMTGVAKTIAPTVTVAERQRLEGAVLHLEEVAAAWTEVLVGIDKLWCCIGLARYYESLSLWGEAERCYRRSRSISEQQLGADHPDTAASLNNLALLYQSQGRYSDAEPLYAQAVATLLQTLGEAHPNTQTGLNNFVTCLQTALAQGQRQFSDHPLTQFLLQHLSNTET